MHVLIDGIHLRPGAKGVGIYAHNVVANLLDLDPALELSLLYFEGAAAPRFEGSFRALPIGWRNHLWHGFRTLPRAVAALRPDVVWVPGETPLAKLAAPFLIVCHDLPSELRRAQEAGGGARRSPLRRLRDRTEDRLLAMTLRRADTVFCNSDYVARGVASSFDVEAEKIHLAPCAPAADFAALSRRVDRDEVRRELGLEQGYVLSFFTGDHRENLPVIPRVYDRLWSSGERRGLVVAGLKPEDRGTIESLCAGYPWRDRVRLLPFFDAGERFELARIYTAASVYFDPSLQEGFGMQVIEAMACGTPVVCSDRGALPEVTGGAALLANPEDAQALAAQLAAVLGDPDVGAELAARGRERARRFTWRRTAEVIHQGLRRAVRRSRSPAEPSNHGS